MDEIRLLKPTMEYEKDIMQFREELINANDNDSFAGCGSLKRCATVEEWLTNHAMRENVETCPEGGVCIWLTLNLLDVLGQMKTLSRTVSY